MVVFEPSPTACLLLLKHRGTCDGGFGHRAQADDPGSPSEEQQEHCLLTGAAEEAMKILLAIDGSAFSEAVVEEISRRPWPAGSEIRVLSIFEPPIPPTPEAWTIPPEYFEELLCSARSTVSTIVDAAIVTLRKALGESITINGEYAQGSAKSVILEEAERWNADLIVVGSHGYPAWKRFLLGSVSQAVVTHAKCSVEVVRSRKQVPGDG